MRFRTGIFVSLLLLLTGCGKETGIPEPVSAPILFEVAATGAFTRAAGEINDDAALRGRSIGVFAAYTGKFTYENTTVSADYMYNQEVRYTTNNLWDYEPVKYWPNDPEDYVSFFAYAPYEADPQDDGRPIFGISRKVDLGDPWINFRLPPYSEQIDLLYGQRYSGGSFSPWLDQKKAAWNDARMLFTFKHALACIGDGISVKMSDALFANMQNTVNITITRVQIEYRNLTTKARLVLRCEDTPNWKEIISGELNCTREFDSGVLTGKMFSKDATANPEPITLDSGHGLFYIPLRIAGMPQMEAIITLSYMVSDGTSPEMTNSAVSTVKFNPAEAGSRQAFAITLTEDLDIKVTVITESPGITMPGDLTPQTGF